MNGNNLEFGVALVKDEHHVCCISEVLSLDPLFKTHDSRPSVCSR